jgi:arginase family enzyme
VEGCLHLVFAQQSERWEAKGCPVHVSLDADVVRAADVPGVSAPAPLGLCGVEVAAWARRAGQNPSVSSFELVEINPAFDVDGRSARWAAVVVWRFLAGLASRPQRAESETGRASPDSTKSTSQVSTPP